MRRSLYASSAIHLGILGWVAFGGLLFERSPEVEFEVTGVALITPAEFEALTSGDADEPAVIEALATPALPQVTDAPEIPAFETPPPPIEQPEQTEAPAPESDPVPVDPVPDTQVSDDVAVLAPPPDAPDAEPSDTPTPEEAPRIAPVAAPLPEPDVETAPEVLEQPTEEAVAEEAPVEEVTETAPEEATTEIVTEAEEPSAARAPTASVRPTARPARPEPVEEAVAEAEVAEEPAEDAPVAEVAPAEEEDALAAAIAGAVAEAVDTPATATASAPAGPPLSQGVRDGFRVAVSSCWNVGSLSTEALGTTVVVAFDMTPDARPETGTIQMIEFTGGSEAAALQAYEAARRAIIRCGTNGYGLPEESYGRWQQVELVFNPEGMRLR
jgi:hypothetical protein